MVTRWSATTPSEGGSISIASSARSRVPRPCPSPASSSRTAPCTAPYTGLASARCSAADFPQGIGRGRVWASRCSRSRPSRATPMASPTSDAARACQIEYRVQRPGRAACAGSANARARGSSPTARPGRRRRDRRSTHRTRWPRRSRTATAPRGPARLACSPRSTVPLRVALPARWARLDRLRVDRSGDLPRLAGCGPPPRRSGSRSVHPCDRRLALGVLAGSRAISAAASTASPTVDGSVALAARPLGLQARARRRRQSPRHRLRRHRAARGPERPRSGALAAARVANDELEGARLAAERASNTVRSRARQPPQLPAVGSSARSPRPAPRSRSACSCSTSTTSSARTTPMAARPGTTCSWRSSIAMRRSCPGRTRCSRAGRRGIRRARAGRRSVTTPWRAVAEAIRETVRGGRLRDPPGALAVTISSGGVLRVRRERHRRARPRRRRRDVPRKQNGSRSHAAWPATRRAEGSDDRPELLLIAQSFAHIREHPHERPDGTRRGRRSRRADRLRPRTSLPRPCSRLPLARSLHDVGEITIPDRILAKPASLTTRTIAHDGHARGVRSRSRRADARHRRKRRRRAPPPRALGRRRLSGPARRHGHPDRGARRRGGRHLARDDARPRLRAVSHSRRPAPS